ncbi:1-acyl-sn-glycerol-3-phosphate acyltransferase (plasmid) [Aneurinibacillus sp. Ricciae_BoGa-3]|uniref:1-acyl-sn-glycerol-3-phosphate acyltransferase n=1 Tax=Aneurinibacillus sp. Ricciae_BoGa-3 TaxID=3022697 RepID=UPI00234095E0|nr:1-acyl-sn-glycerol-3-phosphate acyltransferase [Aneurinibacillus sp. Ricciae_BoGa-3]WCK57316.1 1-acyl-sn-glycerol-3-phosphate acyltransferase [Aneurinibacillus sp. Ricciae_BoGa-3]
MSLPVLPKFVLPALAKMLISCKVIHKERLKREGVCIYIPNHTSLLDAVLMATNLDENVVCVANTQIAKDYAWAMGGREILPVDTNNPYSVRSMLKVLRSGKSLLIFPEGRITVTNSLMKVYPGVAYLAIKLGIPLVPIGIDGAEKAKNFTYLEGKVPTSWFPPTTVYIGKEFSLSSIEGDTMREKKERGSHVIYRKLQEVVLNCRMQGEFSEHLMEILRKRVMEAPNLVIAEETIPNIRTKKF